MNRYELPVPHAAFGAAATALTALTLALMVIAPATLISYGQMTRATVATGAAAVDSGSPLRVDVYGTRERNTAFDRAGGLAPNAKQPG
jgi:hypothetical protein